MTELIHHFGIDWKLLLAQAVNFFILLFLLKRFAYGPILKILNKRKQEIASGLEFTENARKKLETIEVERSKTLKEANKEALSIVTQAEELGKKRKDEIIVDANKKVETIVADAKRLIEEEKAKMGETAYKNAESLVRLGIERVLGKFPEKERDQSLIQEALKELKASKNLS